MMRALVLAALALAVLAALLLAGNAWANARVWNARVEIRDEKIPAAFDGFVLCQVSDVHNEARGRGTPRSCAPCARPRPTSSASPGTSSTPAARTWTLRWSSPASSPKSRRRSMSPATTRRA